MELKPALAQFLIYGPVPGTPFYERIIKDNLLQDVYTSDKDLFYRRADGFRTMIKHPTLSPEEIEDIQRWCFEEDFQRLGPSIFRVLEARLLGYQKLKDSPNPFLRAKAEYYARELRVAYPVVSGRTDPGPKRRGAALDRRTGTADPLRSWVAPPAGNGQVPAGRRRGAVDRTDLEVEPFPASQTDAHDLPDAERTLERVRSLGGDRAQDHKPGTIGPGGPPARQTAGLDAPGRHAVGSRRRMAWRNASPIPWPAAKAGSSWT